MYRTSDESPIVPSLITAAEARQADACAWSSSRRAATSSRTSSGRDALEQAGVHVVYGFPDLKIHAKTTLVVRREGGRQRRYVHIGTGNYHSVTARSYEDLSLFTADERIAADVADLFNFVTGFGRPKKFRKLLVAPLTLQAAPDRADPLGRGRGPGGQARRDRAQGERAHRPGDHPGALPRLRGRRLDRRDLARDLHAPPGRPGLSENIRVRSVLGRYLEHSRLFAFHADHTSSYFIGSADLMPRNLDHRIEIIVPVEDQRAQAELNTTLETLLSDTEQAWELHGDGTWHRLEPAKGERARVAQIALMRRARLRERRQAAYRSRER